MNTELLREIIAGLKENFPARARKLDALLKRYEAEPNEDKKKRIKSQIREFTYHYLTLCMDKDSQFIMQNMGITIANQEREVERKANDHWCFGFAGVARVLIEDGKPTITNFIPRDYQKGFYLNTPENMAMGDKEREINFYFTYASQLSSIARDYDRKQEVVSGAYEPKHPAIKRELMEKMIDFCELTRIKDIPKLHEQVRQYVR